MKNLQNLLVSLGVKISFTHVGVNEDKVLGVSVCYSDRWIATVTRERDGKTITEKFEYQTGFGHRKVPIAWKRENKNRQPTMKEMLKFPAVLGSEYAGENLIEALMSDSECAQMFFEDMCSDYGYDPDSRKSLDTYLKMQSNAIKLRNLFPQELKQIAEEIAADNN